MLRSMLFVPGSNPKQVMFAASLGADGVIFDLEDAVNPQEKDSARILLRNLLKSIDYSNVKVCVRVNSLDSPFWQNDLSEIVPCKPDFIMTPKIESPKDVVKFDNEISRLEKFHKIKSGSIGLVLLIETARGIENCFDSACASKRTVAMALGAEDYTTNLQCLRTKAGNEIDYARKRIVNAARAAEIEVYDTPFTDINDNEGILSDANYAKSLGFSGKLSISPRHVDTINNAFCPSQAEIDNAYAIMDAIVEGNKKGLGVVSFNGKMVDKPVMLRARQTILQSEQLGLSRSDIKEA